MSESENKSAKVGSTPSLEENLDVRKAVSQHLRSLAQCGVAMLPKGTGRFKFEFSQSAAGVPVSSKADRSADSVSAQSADGNGSPVTNSQSQPTATSAATPTSGVETGVETGVQTGSENRGNAASKNTPQPIRVDQDHYDQPLIELAQRAAALEVIQTEVQGCTRCQELSDTRTQTVFGVGNVAARLVLIGEGPGADEDRTGEPFVGAAGQLLNKILGACKLKRDQLYILNTIKCRPPGNRNPAPTELDNCWGYAERQLEVLQPEFICCLGSVAAKRVLNTTQPLGRLRGRFHQYRGSRVLVTYHPAYLLRNESAKKHVWEDMKLLMKEMGVDLSK